jgi:quercetin dioxygenase-like cupin family protein
MPNPLHPDRATIREKLFGGKGGVHIWNCLGNQEAGAFKAALWCALEPGGVVGRHRQEEFSELVVCLNGQGHATVGETRKELCPGALIFLPLGTGLSLHNDSKTQALEYLIIKAQEGV